MQIDPESVYLYGKEIILFITQDINVFMGMVVLCGIALIFLLVLLLLCAFVWEFTRVTIQMSINLFTKRKRHQT